MSTHNICFHGEMKKKKSGYLLRYTECMLVFFFVHFFFLGGNWTNPFSI